MAARIATRATRAARRRAGSAARVEARPGHEERLPQLGVGDGDVPGAPEAPGDGDGVGTGVGFGVGTGPTTGGNAIGIGSP
jgi:hypothetical protein